MHFALPCDDFLQPTRHKIFYLRLLKSNDLGLGVYYFSRDELKPKSLLDLIFWASGCNVALFIYELKYFASS